MRHYTRRKTRDQATRSYVLLRSSGRVSHFCERASYGTRGKSHRTWKPEIANFIPHTIRANFAETRKQLHLEKQI